MYTCDIKKLVTIGKSGVRWKSDVLSPQSIDPYTESQNLRKLWEANTGWGETQERKKFLEALKKITIDNIDNKDRLISQINDEIFALTNAGDAKGAKQLEQFKKTVEADYARLKAQYDKEKTRIEYEKNNKVVELRGTNTRTEQANAFIAQMKGIGLNIVKFTPQSVNSGEADTMKTEIDLSDVSLVGLANHLLKETPYTPDGAYGMREQDMVKKFVEYYNGLSDKGGINKLLASISAANQSGIRIDTMRSNVVINQTDLKGSILTMVKSDGKDAAAKNVENVVTAVVESIPASELPKALVRALKLGGYTGGVDANSVATNLSDQTTRLQLIAGLMRSARHMGGAQGLLAEKIMTPGENYRKLLESLNTDEFKVGFQSRLESVLDTQISELDKKEGRDSQESEKLATLKAYKESLKNPAVFNAHFQGFTAFVTNQGSGVSASWSGRIDTFLADTVSLGLGIDSVSKKPMVGLMFGKALSTNTQIMYGYAGAPIVGVAHRFDAGYDVSIMGNKLGGAISLSKDMQPARRIEEVTAKVSTDAAVLSKIESFSQVVQFKSKDIDFSGLVPDAFKGSGDESSITQERYDAINKEISAAARTYLSMSNFDSETNPYVRASLIQEALRRAIQDRVDAHNYDANSGGWSLAKIGAVLGMFGGAKFILPFVSFERTNIQARVSTSESRVTKKETNKTESLTDDIIKRLVDVDKPIWSEDGKTYSLKLASNSPMNAENTRFISMDGVKIENDAIVGLSGKGINIKKTAEGKYEVSYNNTQVKNATPEDKGTVEIGKINLEQAIRTELSNPVVRQQLSNLWLGGRKGKVNEFATALQQYQTNADDIKLNDANTALLEAMKGLPVLKNLIATIKNSSNNAAALYDIRGAMMMDFNQAKTLKNKYKIEVDEKPEATTKRFNERMLTPALENSSLLVGKGLDVNDFNSVLQSGNGPITLSDAKEGWIGAIASMKLGTNTYMAIMPNGTVRVAMRDGKEFIQDLSGADAAKKNGIFDLVLPENSRGAQEILTKVKSQSGVKTITHENLKTLFTSGELKIGAKTIKMTEQKFYTLAYGDCTNPGVALKPGKISVTEPGKPTVTGESITLTKAEYSVWRTDFSLDATAQSLTAAAGYVRPGRATETTREPNTYETRIEPRDVTISSPISTPTGNVYDVTVGGNTVRLDFQSIARTYGPQARAIIDAVQRGNQLPTLTTTETIVVTVPGVTTINTIQIPITPSVMRAFHAWIMFQRGVDLDIQDSYLRETFEKLKIDNANFNN